ncbi:phage baseplate protein [Megamonas funiformis]|uniref:phage baseplate protein n=2 Tax=Megamonas funiformis TaxID=437897 RepID=UPI0022E79739|nr:phage tail protein [Megamonas funiformis]
MNSLQNRSTLLDKQYDTGQFSACIVTNIGKEMIAKSQNGQTLTFTRVALGDGLIDDDDDILSFTKVKNERLSANIAKWVDKQNGQFQIQFRVSNQEVEIGFWQREIGIMAKIDGGEEQLYAYATSGNGADFLYDKTTPIDERIVNIDFVIGNAENVQVIVNGSIIYATIEDLENAIDEHNADENAHDNLIKRLFGSAEATLDSIKLKIKEWAKEACLPLSGGTMKGNINANGYNITATKFIGNLQGKADSATNADLAAKATTAENANNSSVANKLGTSTVGSATKPVYINNGVASAVSVDLSTLAPKASPGLTGTPTAPTANVDTNDTQLATCAFVRNAISKYSSKDIDVLKKIMHVGYIHFSTVNINPAELFGFGTWEAMPAGRVLLAQGKVETENYTHNFVAGETGGEFVHQLTVGEMPSHTHTASINTTGNHHHGTIWTDGSYCVWGLYDRNCNHRGMGAGNDWDNALPNTSTDGNHSHTVTINNTGSNNAHNNLQPYISVYIWKRTA